MPLAHIAALPHLGIAAYNGRAAKCKPLYDGFVGCRAERELLRVCALGDELGRAK